MDVTPEFTISDLKLLIDNQTNWHTPNSSMRLIFQGFALDDNITLAQYHINELKTVHLVLNLRGGMFHQTSGKSGNYDNLKSNMFDIEPDMLFDQSQNESDVNEKTYENDEVNDEDNNENYENDENNESYLNEKTNENIEENDDENDDNVDSDVNDENVDSVDNDENVDSDDNDDNNVSDDKEKTDENDE